MENASKALIIAGAILLSILLISLGIMIFTQAQDVVTGSGMTEAQISAFNDQFVKYEGDRKGTMVKSLIQDILATNSESGANDGINVAVIGDGADDNPFPNDDVGTTTPSTSKIVNNNTYKVELRYGGPGNRVNKIKITGKFKS